MKPGLNLRQEQLRERLGALGFDDVRFASLAPPLRSGLPEWLNAGMQADMDWMERTADKRQNPDLVLQGARTAILLGVSYWSEALRTTHTNPNPLWARYALYDDYHDSVKPALITAGRVLEELYGIGERDYRYYVDTGPVLERGWAARAGLGFIGKNAMLISRRHGNWLFLAAILTRLDLEADAPITLSLHARRAEPPSDVGLLCGKCTRCLDACPTAAFPKPGVVDARRCISYQTIENKGIIPRELRRGIGNRIYGCDVCLEVCPWNRFAREGRRMLVSARYDLADLTLREILDLTPERFAQVFRRTPIKRLKLTGLLRNACVVAGNSGDETLVPQLVRLATHESAIVRAHAVWAVFELARTSRATLLLGEARTAETTSEVMDEYAAGISARNS